MKSDPTRLLNILVRRELGHTLRAIGGELGVSAQRVHQLEKLGRRDWIITKALPFAVAASKEMADATAHTARALEAIASLRSATRLPHESRLDFLGRIQRQVNVEIRMLADSDELPPCVGERIKDTAAHHYVTTGGTHG